MCTFSPAAWCFYRRTERPEIVMSPRGLKTTEQPPRLPAVVTRLKLLRVLKAYLSSHPPPSTFCAVSALRMVKWMTNIPRTQIHKMFTTSRGGQNHPFHDWACRDQLSYLLVPFLWRNTWILLHTKMYNFPIEKSQERTEIRGWRQRLTVRDAQYGLKAIIIRASCNRTTWSTC